MTKSTTVLLRIRPLEYYFFGGESTFGDGEGANYFARSNSFPQQTTVLGLLRRLLFDTKKPIGESFQANRSFKQNFGAITTLSPVFLMDGEGKGWLPHALDAHTATKKAEVKPESEPFDFSTSRGLGEAFTGLGQALAWTAAPYFKKADSKKGLTDLLIAQNGETCERDSVFKKFTRIGITKFRRGAKQEERRDAFYKQEMYKLTEGWSFAVVVGLETGFDADFFDGKTVAFGGEKCLARVEVMEKNASFESIFQSKNMYKKRLDRQVVLLSDALVGDDFFKNCTAVIAEITPFRNIITPSNPKSYGPIRPTINDEFLFKTGKMTLLKSGSVLFATADGTKAITDALDDEVHFRQIGYNHYLTF